MVNKKGFYRPNIKQASMVNKPDHMGMIPKVRFPKRKKNKGKHMDEGQFSNPIVITP